MPLRADSARAVRAIAAVLVGLAVSPGARDAAAADAADASIAGGDPRVRFRAGRLVLDTRQDRLELEGHVVVSVDRYRLSSDHLTLERTPRGVLLRGGGRVAFCPCENPPLTFGFRSALVAPPTDLLLEQPTVRIGPVPVLWLPYLWLRSPERFGLLPLRLAYRGSDGPLIGSGLHVPIGSARVDVAGAGYTKGGVDTEIRVTTARTTTRVRWDHLGEDLVMLDLRGALNPSEHAAVAWGVDALRGARALGGPVSLEEVALRQDRARAAAAFSNGITTAGLSVLADGRRGDGVLGAGTAGPSAYAGASTRMGDSGMMHAGASVTTLRVSAGASVTLAAARAEARASETLGAFTVDVEGRARAVATIAEAAQGHMAGAGATAELALPLVNDFGPLDGPLQHWVVPFASVTAGALDRSARSVADAPIPNGGFYGGLFGVRSTLGATAGVRGAITGSAAGGFIGGAAAPVPAATARLGGRAGIASARAELVGVVKEQQRSYLAIAHLRAGSELGPFVSGRVAFESESLPASPRLLGGTAWDAPWVPWLDRGGTTVGGSVGVPWTRWLATKADADYDATRREILGVRGSASYLHPCGCVAVAVWSGTRLGRRTAGLPDTWLTVDLMP